MIQLADLVMRFDTAVAARGLRCVVVNSPVEGKPGEVVGVSGLSAFVLALFILVFHLSQAERRQELFQPPVPAPRPWFAVLCALVALAASGVTLDLWFA